MKFEIWLEGGKIGMGNVWILLLGCRVVVGRCWYYTVVGKIYTDGMGTNAAEGDHLVDIKKFA
jgi:hypothetical protein